MTSLVAPPTYWQSLQAQFPDLAIDRFTQLHTDLETTDWDEPRSGLDLNNFAVMALVEAEQAEDESMRILSFDLALQALVNGSEIATAHPLCVAHLALARSLMGEPEAATQLAYSALIELLQPAFNRSQPLPLGLIYLPASWGQTTVRQNHLQQMLGAEDGIMQALLLLSEVLCRSQLVFYNATGARFCELATQIASEQADVHLKLGLARVMAQQWEGLVQLQQARKLDPTHAAILQSLYLAYRDLGREAANEWLRSAQAFLTQPQALEWQWAKYEITHPFTYVPFDGLLMAVEPSLRSIVTTVLLGEGDWFEAEMAFWRSQLQPGMTVIDVGANVGVYTFSAAQRVGATGRVLAIEPFSGCVQCLEETQRVNQLNWVTVCRGAASDRVGTACLSLHSASELNELIPDDGMGDSNQAETVSCFTLDHLIEQEEVTRVDWLKIDAEGHEMQVLAGADRLLTQFAPAIIYENIAAARSSNIPVAEFLLSRGYRLFRYHSYLNSLNPIDALQDLQGNLNLIALPAHRLP